MRESLGLGLRGGLYEVGCRRVGDSDLDFMLSNAVSGSHVALRLRVFTKSSLPRIMERNDVHSLWGM